MHIARRAVTAATLFLALVAAAPAQADDVTFTTEDGVSISADVTGDGENGIVLVHEEGRSGQDWSMFARKLTEGGFRVVALDLRGHGDSSVEGALTEEDYPKMVSDVSAAVKWLRDSGTPNVALVGAGLGANLAALAAAADPEVKNLALLSAGMNLKGVKIGDAITQYGERPIFIATGEEDTYAFKSSMAIQAKAQAPQDKKLHHLSSGSTGGIRMLTRDPELEFLLVSWLDGSYAERQAAGDIEGRRSVTTGDTTGIETSGKKFGEDK